MNSLSLISLPPETLQRMYAQRQQPACGAERSERRMAWVVVAGAMAAALLFALFGA
jgi:hypothetical protein